MIFMGKMAKTIVLFALLVIFAACGGDSDINLTGTWEFFGSEGELVSTYEFTEDSYTLTYYTHSGNAVPRYGTYEITNGNLSLLFEDGGSITQPITLSGNTLKVGITQYKRK